jgi:anti-anti-sigma factor
MSHALTITNAQAQSRVPVTVLRLSGDLDSKTYPDLDTQADALIAAGARNILLDLSDVQFMGSAGLRAMHGISNKLKGSAGGGQVKLLNPSEPVARVLKTLGFDQFFEIHSTYDAAVQSF